VNLVINGFGDAVAIETERQALEAASGGKAIYSGHDLTKVDQIEAMMAEAAATFGGIDILINNAGMQHVAPVEEFPVDKWNLIIALNLNSAFHTTRLAVPYMKEKKWGRIIQTASAHSLVASPFKSAYVTAKHGLAGFTKTIALELATFGVTANCISPGYVWTPLVENQIPDTMKARGMTREQVINDVLLAGQPTKQFVTAEQVAEIALFLCSDAAAQITGTNISVDGGWTAG
jgi:3-hydroxybutyrate dehydrogenase